MKKKNCGKHTDHLPTISQNHFIFTNKQLHVYLLSRYLQKIYIISTIFEIRKEIQQFYFSCILLENLVFFFGQRKFGFIGKNLNS